MTDDEPVKIRVTLTVSHAYGARYEETVDGPPRSEWDQMSEGDQDEYLDECAQTVLSNQIEVCAEVES